MENLIIQWVKYAYVCKQTEMKKDTLFFFIVNLPKSIKNVNPNVTKEMYSFPFNIL